MLRRVFELGIINEELLNSMQPECIIHQNIATYLFRYLAAT